jgi:hypothetical protein
MLIRRAVWLFLVLLFTLSTVYGQETTYGISLPITVSGGAGYSHGPENNDVDGAFRVVVSPTLNLGPHWFAYAALEARSSSYLGYIGTADDNPAINFTPMQAYVGYRRDIKNGSFIFKAGQLSSAFGLGPLEYDDSTMPLIGPPPVYETNLPLRSDQLPCGVKDLLWQSYGSDVTLHCGGASVGTYGIVPVTLYGLPGLEAEISWKRVDARLQITNSSPANSQSLLSSNQFGQWAAGGGYSFHGGLHIGVSGFRGPYLDHIAAPFLPAGKSISDFPASGFGTDVEWSGGSWSTEGEWQHFQFSLPEFTVSPSAHVAYAQIKKIVNPRIFLAARTTVLDTGRAVDLAGTNAARIRAPQQIQEIGIGYRLSRRQLVKMGLDWANIRSWSAGNEFWPGMHAYGIQLQIVTSVNGFSKALR